MFCLNCTSSAKLAFRSSKGQSNNVILVNSLFSIEHNIKCMLNIFMLCTIEKTIIVQLNLKSGDELADFV